MEKPILLVKYKIIRNTVHGSFFMRLDNSKQEKSIMKEQPEEKKEESGETTETSDSDQEPELADKEEPGSREKEEESKQLAGADKNQLKESLLKLFLMKQRGWDIVIVSLFPIKPIFPLD